MRKPIGEQSALNISLPMLIQAIGFIAALVYGYGQLNTRLQFVEHQSEMNDLTIKEMKSFSWNNSYSHIIPNISNIII